MLNLDLGKRLLIPQRLLLAGILAFVVVLGMACGEEATPTPTATVLPPTPTPAPFPLVITDSNGNEVSFETPPERIVAYDSDSVEILFAMGEGHRIAGDP